jgi:hypothetical protein
MDPARQAYDEVYAYTMGRPSFILQHVVDAHAAQTASADNKPLGLAFALAGLYLHLERRFTGRQVQHAHMRMGQVKRTWPVFPLPADRGSITAIDVLAAPEGAERDRAIDEWCASVWTAYRACRPGVIALLAELKIG